MCAVNLTIPLQIIVIIFYESSSRMLARLFSGLTTRSYTPRTPHINYGQYQFYFRQKSHRGKRIVIVCVSLRLFDALITYLFYIYHFVVRSARFLSLFYQLLPPCQLTANSISPPSAFLFSTLISPPMFNPNLLYNFNKQLFTPM